MAFGTSRIFKSTDEGAPQLRANTSSLCAVLQAVLVNGYGSTASLGWEGVFYNGTDKVVFRPSYMGYVRPFIRIHDVSDRYAYMHVYSSMYDIDNGVEKKPDGANAYIHKCMYAYPYNTGELIPWIIAGDEAGFYFSTAAAKGYYLFFTNEYVGAMNLFDVSNKFNFSLMYPNSTSMISNVAGGANGNMCYFLLRNPLKTRGATYLTPNYMSIGVPPLLGKNTINGVYSLSNIIYNDSAYNCAIGMYPGLNLVSLSRNISIPLSLDRFPWEMPTNDGGSLLFLYSYAGFSSLSANFTYAGTTAEYACTVAIKIGKGFRNVW